MMSTVPILEASRQPSPGFDPADSPAYWAGLQPTRPSPSDGLIVIPSGRTTSVFFAWPSAIASGFSRPAFGMFGWKSKPLGFDASLLVAAAATMGLSGTLLHPCSPGASNQA